MFLITGSIVLSSVIFKQVENENLQDNINKFIQSNTNILLAISLPTKTEAFAYSITKERYDNLPKWSGELSDETLPIISQDKAIKTAIMCLENCCVCSTRHLERVELRRFELNGLEEIWFYDIEILCHCKNNVMILMDGKIVDRKEIKITNR